MKMLHKSNDSSSSEDEELQNALKEATDEQFFKNTSFSKSKSEAINISGAKNGHYNSEQNKKSLRANLEEKNEFTNFSVTPTFQNFVANKLDLILENSIEINEVKGGTTNKKNTEDNVFGIKLLSSSEKFVVTEEETCKEKSTKRKVESVIDWDEHFAKCKEVAVDPERILSKVETKAWTNRRKEPEFKYKRVKSGVLIEKA